MTGLVQIIGIAALVPAMAGPISAPVRGDPARLTLALCQGGKMAIPMEQGGLPDMQATICCAKGCHRGKKRTCVDPEQ
tara:strand:- start:365 stop:598 length:234 start_codon:yes stop_codon:yes gene_type:complete